MKNLSACLGVCLLVLCTSSLHAQNFIWARQAFSAATGTGEMQIANAVSGPGEDAYSGGTFTDSASFDGITAYNSGVFLARYNSSGYIQSVIQSTASSYMQLIATCKDHSNHIYLLGYYEGTAHFGSLTITGDVGVASYFVAQYDFSGGFTWVRSYYNAYQTVINPYIRLSNIACDPQDNIYISGNVEGAYNANGISCNTNGDETFIARLSPFNGLASWTQMITGTAIKGVERIVTDASNNIVISGSYFPHIPAHETCIFNGTDTIRTGLNTSLRGAFMAKYGQNGNYIWAKTLNGQWGMDLSGMACDNNRNIYITGVKQDSAVQGNYYYNFIAKLDSTGQQAWLNHDYAEDISISSSGIYAVSGFNDSFIYHNQLQLVAHGENNVIIKIEPVQGNLLWASQPMKYVSSKYLLSASDNGHILLTGNSPWPALKLGSSNLYNNGRSFVFTALLADTAYTPVGNGRITGNIFNDINANCLLNTGEPALPQFSVVALPGPYYGTADASGNYTVKTSPGIFTVKQVVPLGHHIADTLNCFAAGHNVTLSAPSQVSAGNDFGNRYHSCYLLELYAPAAGYFCGHDRARTIRICNNGVDAAPNTVLKIKYPGQFVTPVSSSIPWTSYNPLDSTLTFNLGNLPPDTCLNLVITDTVACAMSTMPFVSLPFSFTLTPYNSCYPQDTVLNSINLDEHIVLPIAVGTTVPAAARNIAIQPNPTSGGCTVTGVADGDVVEVYSAVGQKIFGQRVTTAGKITLDLSARSPGLYFITVRNANTAVTKKLVKI